MKIAFDHTLLILLVSLVLSNCGKKSSNVLPNQFEEVSIMDQHGNYVSADKTEEYCLIANRSSIDSWETFRINYQEGSLVQIQNIDYGNVRLNEQNQLIFGSSEDERYEPFRLLEIDSAHYQIQTKDGLFVKIDSNQKLVVGNSNENPEVFEIKPILEVSSLFSSNEYTWLISGFLSLLMSLILFIFYRKISWSLVFLLLGGFLLRMFIGVLDPFLNIWDEQFHALVAKNMMEHPFSPMLYKSQLFDGGTYSWIGSHIWLHKQPLFLWQIALSMKVFGVNALAVRMPSIILSTIVIGCIYRVGTLLVSKETGYFSALLFACSHFCLTLVAGGYATDHNDIAFMFYISASIWAWIEYKNAITNRKKYIFLVLIGLFSGAAVLVKWLVGLLVYSGWGISIIALKKNRKEWRNYFHLAISLLITLIVFLPWQWYISSTFPEQSAYEFALNTSHFFNVIEGHGGDGLYHLTQTNYIYGFAFVFMIIFFVLLAIKIKPKEYKYFTITCFVIVYLFFSIAATKMIAFTFAGALFGFLALGSFAESLTKLVILNKELVKKRVYARLFKLGIILFLVNNTFNFEKIQEDHTMASKNEDSEFFKKLNNNTLFHSFRTQIPNQSEYILFNTTNFEHIQAMFFCDFEAAYDGIPSMEAIKKVKENGYKLALIKNDKLPDYVVNDPEILLISGYKF